MYKSSWGRTFGCSKHVKDTIIKLKQCKKCIFCWFLWQRYVTMYGSTNVKKNTHNLCVDWKCVSVASLESHYSLYQHPTLRCIREAHMTHAPVQLTPWWLSLYKWTVCELELFLPSSTDVKNDTRRLFRPFYSCHVYWIYIQVCKNLLRQVAEATELCTLVPNVC